MKITVELDDQIIIDVFNTAMEGGVNYWADFDEYQWLGLGLEFFATVRDMEDEDAEWLRVDAETIRKGLTLAAKKGRREVGTIFAEDYDAYDADVIVQLGLFGEIVFG